MKTNIYIYLICSMILSIFTTLTSCSKEDNNESNTEKNEVKEDNNEKLNYGKMTISPFHYTNGKLYEIFLCNYDIDDIDKLEEEGNVNPDIFIKKVYIAIYSEDGSFPNGTFEYDYINTSTIDKNTKNAWIDIYLWGHYWDKPSEYSYTIEENFSRAYIEIKTDSEGNISLETFDTTVFFDDGDGDFSSSDALDINLSFKGKIKIDDRG